MRIDRFQTFTCELYRQAPEVADAVPWQEGAKRPFGVEIRLTTGTTIRHAITTVRPEGEDPSAEEEIVEGPPPEPIEPRPAPGGVRSRETAAYLAAVLSSSGHPEVERVYTYSADSVHPGFGVICHSGAKMHMLLI